MDMQIEITGKWEEGRDWQRDKEREGENMPQDTGRGGRFHFPNTHTHTPSVKAEQPSWQASLVGSSSSVQM